ncbi:MAG: hypothetical protein KIT80_03255 [Chitinophagaceae bacterium]|nr:hypothetical protein [Chitinophagaceae bacterium]MCW5925903.1 hypothetical protein [Chitinophagaceae bacterium]
MHTVKLATSTFNEGEETEPTEGQLPFRVFLSLVPQSQFLNIILNKSSSDFDLSYSAASSLRFEPITSYEYILSGVIDNYGDVDSELTYLQAIVWKRDGSSIFKRFKTPTSIYHKSSSPFYYTGLFQNDFGVSNFADILNAFFIVCDPLMDKYEDELKKFIDKNITQDRYLQINPCRYSPKVVSWNLQMNPLEVENNIISELAGGYYDVILLSRSASNNADIGITIGGNDRLLYPNLPETNTPILLCQTPLVHKGDVSFYLNSNGRQYFSTDTTSCKISQPSTGIVDLEWEDHGDPNNPSDFDDYKIRLIHR